MSATKEDKSSHEGGGMGKVWVWLIVVIIVMLTGLLGYLTDSLNSFFQMVRFNFGPILMLIGAIWILSAIFGGKKAGGEKKEDGAH